MKIRACLSALSEPPLPVLLLLSLLAWLVMFYNGTHDMYAHSPLPHEIVTPMLHHVHDESSINIQSHEKSLVTIAWMWLFMVIAMMFPLLSDPIRQVWTRNFPRKRLTGIFAFLTTYISVWMLIGMVLSAIAAFMQQHSNDNEWLSLGAALSIILLWQSSPWKQACLNHCHILPRISPFGLAAERDCGYYGFVKGAWCVGSCWALMLLPMLAMKSGTLVMLIASVVMFIEQLLPSRPVRWQLPYRWLFFR